MEKITILFGTVMGSAEGCALKIVATSTTGDGDPPENAIKLHAHLSNDKPDVTGITFAV